MNKTKIIEEKKLLKYPIETNIKGINKINDQLESCICKIYTETLLGTGFFCVFEYNKKLITLLVTNNHILNQNHIINGKVITISLNNDKIMKKIKINKERRRYTNNQYDITIIEIKNTDNLGNKYMLLDYDIFKEEEFLNNLFRNSPIYLLFYKEKEASVSFGIVDKIDKNKIYHLCTTYPGASGGPILSMRTNKIIGMHRGTDKSNEINIGITLKYGIKEFFNCLKENNNNNVNSRIKREVHIQRNRKFKNNEYSKNISLEKKNNNNLDQRTINTEDNDRQNYKFRILKANREYYLDNSNINDIMEEWSNNLNNRNKKFTLDNSDLNSSISNNNLNNKKINNNVNKNNVINNNINYNKINKNNQNNKVSTANYNNNNNKQVPNPNYYINNKFNNNTIMNNNFLYQNSNIPNNNNFIGNYGNINSNNFYGAISNNNIYTNNINNLNGNLNNNILYNNQINYQNNQPYYYKVKF